MGRHSKKATWAPTIPKWTKAPEAPTPRKTRSAQKYAPKHATSATEPKKSAPKHAPKHVATSTTKPKASAKRPSKRTEPIDEPQSLRSLRRANPPAPSAPSSHLRHTHHKRPEVLWDWFDLLLISLTLVIAFFVSGNVINSTLARLLPGSGLAILKLVLVLVFYVIEILVVAYIAHRHSFTFATLYRLRTRRDEEEPAFSRLRETLVSAGMVIALLLLTRGIGMLWSFVTADIGWIPTSTGDLLTMFGTTPASMALAVLCVVVIAPFIEEIIFRGVFLSTLETSMSRFVAVIVTALIFAVYHASVWAFFPHVVLGLALGYLAVTRRTLWPAIALHALYNAVLMATAFYATHATPI